MLLASSVLLRIGYVAEISGGPLLEAHRWSATDASFFDQWGRSIAAGDWGGHEPLHPYFDWQRTAADVWFRLHPGEAERWGRGGTRGDQDAPVRNLWNFWYHGREFHQEPLYAYLIGATYAVSGTDVNVVFFWQMLLGVLTNLLVYDMARRWFGETAGIVAAAMVLFCAPLFSLELTLLRSTLTAFLLVALLWTVERALQSPTPRRWLIAGVAGGLALLCQTTFLLLWMGSLALLLVRHRAGRRQALRLAAVSCAGTLLVLAPAIARNLAAGVPPLRWAANSAQTFLTYNSPGFRPELGVAAPVAENEVRILGDARGELLPVVAGTLAGHGSPVAYAGLLARKFVRLWNWYEEPDNQNFYYTRLHSAVVRYAPFTMWLAAPLILVGCGLAMIEMRPCWMLYLAALTAILVDVLIYAIGRYRAQYLPALIPFAALAVARGIEWGRGRRFRPLALLAVAAVALFVWTSQPLAAGRTEIRAVDYMAPYDYYWIERHNAVARAGQWRRAAAILTESLRFEPPYVASDPQLAAFFADIHRALANDLTRSGDATGAGREQRLSAELSRAATRR